MQGIEKEVGTCDEGHLLVGFRKRVLRASPVPRPDDEGAMDASPEAGDVGVPPQRAFLPGDGEPVGEAVVWADGALGDHRHPVGPAVHLLLHAMPAENTYIYTLRTLSPVIHDFMHEEEDDYIQTCSAVDTYVPMDCHVVR